MKSFKFATVLLGGVILVGCSSEQSPYQYPRKIPEKFQPKIAKTPSKYFMTVKGYVAPEYRKHLRLNWILVYYTHNPKCSYVVDKFDGVYSSREKDIYYPVHLDSTGHYIYRLPLQKFSPGFCKWRVEAVRYLFNDEKLINAAYMANFSPKAEPSSQASHSLQTWTCADKFCKKRRVLRAYGFSTSTKSISSEQKHSIQFDIVESKV